MDRENHLSWSCDRHTSSELYRRRFGGPVGALLIRRQNELLLSLLGDIAGKTVLDVGAGHGQLTPALAAAGARVTAYGSSEEALAPLAGAGVVRVTGPLHPLPFRDGEFDIAVSFRSFPHVPDWRAFLAELCRVSREAVAFDFVPESATAVLKPLAFRLKMGKEPGTRDYTMQKEREVTAAARAAGCDLKAREGQFILPLVLHRMAGRPLLMPAERLAGALGLTRRWGAPVILVLERRKAGADPSRDLLMRLFDKSVAKKAKLAALLRFMPPAEGLNCLDLGGDNGVVSALLRERGGIWHSGDLTDRSVDSIRSLVGSNVFKTDGSSLPFPDRSLDVVVVIDLLEHLVDDGGCVRELARILKPGGTLLVNVPHAKRRSAVRVLRRLAGLTDERHGHLREGYTPDGLRALLGDRFAVEGYATYSRFFTEMLDILVNLGCRASGDGDAESGGKGLVITGADLAKREKQFRLYAAIYPLLRLWSLMDGLLFFTKGHKLILRARRLPEGSASQLQ